MEMWCVWYYFLKNIIVLEFIQSQIIFTEFLDLTSYFIFKIVIDGWLFRKLPTNSTFIDSILLNCHINIKY